MAPFFGTSTHAGTPLPRGPEPSRPHRGGSLVTAAIRTPAPSSHQRGWHLFF